MSIDLVVGHMPVGRDGDTGGGDGVRFWKKGESCGDIPRRYRGTPLKRGWLPHIIVEYVVYSTWSRVARPLFRGVARRAGVCS